jgi:hypothetical protein
MTSTKIKRRLACMIGKLCRVGAGDRWTKTAYRRLRNFVGWKCNWELGDDGKWILNVVLLCISNVSAGNNIVSRATFCPRATGWTGMAPVFRAKLFLCLKVGGRQLVSPKRPHVFNELNSITSYKEVGVLWTVKCPRESFNEVCWLKMRRAHT